VCRAIAVPFGYVQQPRVIAEVIGGILLGPTALGRWTWFSETLFQSTSLKPLGLLANLGLIFFLLLMGLELDLAIVKQRARVSIMISLAGIVVPFALSIGVSYFFYYNLPNVSDGGSFINFLLFTGVAMSITVCLSLTFVLIGNYLTIHVNDRSGPARAGSYSD
jgi:Kef-type K+ transport system membrane component KefB